MCLTIAPVHQVWPDDHLLRETEHPQPSSLKCWVINISWVSHHALSLKYPESDKSNLWSVEQKPPVCHLLFPANISWILPQQLHLVQHILCLFIELISITVVNPDLELKSRRRTSGRYHVRVHQIRICFIIICLLTANGFVTRWQYTFTHNDT